MRGRERARELALVPHCIAKDGVREQILDAHTSARTLRTRLRSQVPRTPAALPPLEAKGKRVPKATPASGGGAAAATPAKSVRETQRVIESTERPKHTQRDIVIERQR